MGLRAPSAGLRRSLTNGAVNSSEGRKVRQRDLGWLERWASASLSKLNKAKCKVWQPGQDNPRLGDKCFKSSPVEKTLGYR